MNSKQKNTIIGVDEAGRGPLAGPIVAGAVVLPFETLEAWAAEEQSTLPWLTDSKKVSAKRREILYEEITHRAQAWAVSFISNTLIDQFNIRNATQMALKESVEECVESCTQPVRVLVDGRERIEELSYPQREIISGDLYEISIAAASIVAKVSRDRYMLEQDSHYPEYGFAKHKGYGTKAHREAIATHGPCVLHRKSFCRKIQRRK